MRVISNLLMAIGVIAIIIFILLIVGYVLFLSTPDIKSDIGAVPVSATAAQSYNDKYTAFETEIEEAAIDKVKKEVVLTVTDEEVNSKIVELMAEGAVPFNEMLVSFKGDAAWIYFVPNTPGANAKIGMILRPNIQNGGIKVEVIEFHVGKLPLPKSIEESAVNFINVIVNLENPANDLPIHLTSVVISNNTITIKAMTTPAE